MTVFSLLYASRSTIPSEETEAAIGAIVDVSRPRNMAAGITGCLFFGDGRFAQALEGDKESVEDIMRSISRDTRHTEVTILERAHIDTRRFADWALGYAGPSVFVHRSIAIPMATALHGSQRGISDLLSMMIDFRAENAGHA